MKSNPLFQLGVNPCESRVCKGYETCAINRFGIAQCTCASICDPIIRPVCGTDNRTYDNQCELNLSTCREEKNVSVGYLGTCGKTRNLFLKSSLIVSNEFVWSGQNKLRAKTNIFSLHIFENCFGSNHANTS